MTADQLTDIALTIGAGALVGVIATELGTLGVGTPAAIAQAAVAGIVITVIINVLETKQNG